MNIKKHNQIAKLEQRISNYESKIREANNQFLSNELSEKRRAYFERINIEKIELCKKEIDECIFKFDYIEKCNDANIPIELLNFTSGPLTIFISKNMSFWQYLFPNYKSFKKTMDESYSNYPFIVKANNAKQGPLIGTATDLLMGFMVGNPLIDKAMQAPKYEDSGFLASFAICFFYRVRNEITLSMRPSEWKHSNSIIAFIVCLAKIEISYRASKVVYRPEITALKNLDPFNSTYKHIEKAVLGISDLLLIHEIKSLGDSLFEILPNYKHSYYNPTFKSYGSISKSDADIILDKTLYDLKCLSPQSTLSEKYIFQIIGYYILAKLNNYKPDFTHVGIINPRNKFKFSISIDELIHALGAESVDSVIYKFKTVFLNSNRHNAFIRNEIQLFEKENHERKKLKKIT